MVPGWSLHRGCCRRPAAASWFPYIDFPPRCEPDRDGTEPRNISPLRLCVCMYVYVCKLSACRDAWVSARARSKPREGSGLVGIRRARAVVHEEGRNTRTRGLYRRRICGEGGATFCTSTGVERWARLFDIRGPPLSLLSLSFSLSLLHSCDIYSGIRLFSFPPCSTVLTK